MKRISLCLIVRDEEKHLARCLSSVQDVVDEICLVDTGSTDATLEIARGFGAKIRELPWPDDFAQARNASLEMATGDWILVLDADEELLNSAEARESLQRFAAEDCERLGRLLIQNVDGDGQQSEVEITRFFPREGFRFAGRIHEQVVSEDSDSEPQRASTGVCVRHDGYALRDEGRAQKLERNSRLLQAELSDHPEDGYLWFQLGRTRFVGDDHPGALEAFEQAMNLCPDEADWAASLFEYSGYALRSLGHSQQALDLLGQVEEHFGDRADSLFLISLLAMDCGELDRAEAGFKRCLELDGQSTAGSESANSAATYAPAFNLGVMKEVLGQVVEAEHWFRRALEFHPGHPASLQALERLAVAH